MRYIFLVTLLSILASIPLKAQTTSFKDNRWFDTQKSNWYKSPNREQSEVVVSDDSIIVHLGSKIIRYKIKDVTDVSTKTASRREYKVDDMGTEVIISISRTMEEYYGSKRQIAWISGDGWIVLTPLTSITPLGYLFPGDVKIDIQADRARIAGYYDYDFMRRIDAEQYNKVHGDTYPYVIWTDDKCKKDIQIEIRPDNTGTWWYGQTAKNCTNKSEQTFKWKLEEVIAEGRRAMMLTLTDGTISDQYLIDELSDKKLTLKGEFKIGDDKDTTSTAFLVLKKKKK